MAETETGFAVDLRVRRDTKNDEWVLTEPLIWRGDWETLFIKPGFRTDFASVPRIVRWLLDAGGRNAAAGVLHDVTWRESKRKGASRIDPWNADGLFRRALRLSGVAPVPRNLLWVGVRFVATLSGRLGSFAPPSSFGKLLRLAMWVVLALPVVIPPGLAIAIGYLIYLAVALLTWVPTTLYAMARAKKRGVPYNPERKLPRFPSFPSSGPAPCIDDLVVIPHGADTDSVIEFDAALLGHLESFLEVRAGDPQLHWQDSEDARALVETSQCRG